MARARPTPTKMKAAAGSTRRRDRGGDGRSGDGCRGGGLGHGRGGGHGCTERGEMVHMLRCRPAPGTSRARQSLRGKSTGMTRTRAPRPCRRAPRDVHDLCERLRAQGKRAWIVGGCVRDLLAGRDAERLGRRDRRAPGGAAPGLPAGHPHRDRARHRHRGRRASTATRSRPCAGRGPTPTAAGPTGSSSSTTSRRTWRGATSPSTRSPSIPVDGKLIDPFDGRGDLARGLLRAVGDPQRALLGGRPARTARRPLRGDARARARSRHRGAIRPTLGTYRKVAAERVRDEWIKTMKARDAVARVRRHAPDRDPRGHLPRAARGRGHGTEQVARLRRVAPRHGVHGRLRGRSHPAHRGAPARRRQAAHARVVRQDEGLHLLRSRPRGRRDRRADPGAPALLERRSGPHRRRSSATTCSTTAASGPTRPCAAGSAAWARSASRTSTSSTRPTCAPRGATSRPDLEALGRPRGARCARARGRGRAVHARPEDQRPRSHARAGDLRPGASSARSSTPCSRR